MASPDRMSRATREAIVSVENQVFVSAASVWEIAIKRAAGRLVFPLEQFDDIAMRMGFEVLPIHPAHAVSAGGLPRHHGDPFDRMLVAQALVEGLVLVSEDREIGRYQVRIFGSEG